MEPRKMMGLDDPHDQKVQIPVRAWSALKLGLWRSKTAWEITERAAAEIVDRCEHAEGCPGEEDETVPCSQACPDRETRMSALVILGAARMFKPIDARQLAREAYHAPSREFFSEVMSELAAAQAELEMLRAALRTAGIEPPSPPPNAAPALPAKKPAALLEENT